MNEMNLHYEYMKDSPLVFLRPGGSPTAPIVSGELSGQYVEGPVEIAIPFDLANTNTTLEFWAKPDATGPIAQFAGHEIVYTGGTYRVSNGDDEYAEISVPSNTARHLSITVMSSSIILSVDGQFDEVGKEFYTPTVDEKAIIFPFSGGLIDYVALYSHQVDKNRLRYHYEKGRELPDFAYDSLSKMSDDERMNVTVENFLPVPLVVPDESLMELAIPHDPDATSFKFEWEQTGNVFISFDNEWRPSGYSTNVFPEQITLDIFEGTLHNFVLTTYGDNSVNSGDQEAHLTTPYSTATAETHPLLHSDLGGALGGVEITPKGAIHEGRSWSQSTPPGTTYRWTGTPNNSPSEKVVNGEVVVKNIVAKTSPNNRGDIIRTDDFEWGGKFWTHMVVVTNAHGLRIMTVLEELTDGETYTASCEVANPGELPVRISTNWSNVPGSPIILLPPGESTRLYVTAARETYDNVYRFMDVGVILSEGHGDTLLVRAPLVTAGSEQHEYFDGDMQYEPAGTYYRWTGEPHASAAEKIADGVVVATNLILNPRRADNLGNVTQEVAEYQGQVWTRLTTDTSNHGARANANLADGDSTKTYIGSWLVANDGDLPVRLSTDTLDLNGRIWTLQPGEVKRIYAHPVKREWTSTFRFTDLSISLSEDGNDSVLYRDIMLIEVPEDDPAPTPAYFDGDFPDYLANDLWINTDDDTAYMWNDGTWIEATDEAILEGSLIGTVSFWTNKKNGEITPGVTVTDGIVTGAQFLNGVPATLDPMHGWYMVTLTGVWGEPLVLNGPVSNITLDKTQLSAAEVNRLYRSFFGFDSVILESNTLSVTDNTPFSITTSWAIVSSG